MAKWQLDRNRPSPAYGGTFIVCAFCRYTDAQEANHGNDQRRRLKGNDTGGIIDNHLSKFFWVSSTGLEPRHTRRQLEQQRQQLPSWQSQQQLA
jgi:hypothetical protein